MKKFYIVCEGKSERAYLQLLNRFLQDREILLGFESEDAGGGQVSKLKEGWGRLRKRAGKEIMRGGLHRCCIWADKDLFIRNDQGWRDAYERERDNLPKVRFNGHNFEDFLSLHLPPERAREWCLICNGLGHFTEPLHSCVYGPRFIDLAPGYRKGRLPDGFDVKEGLEYLRKNVTDNRILQKSDFADFLLDELVPYWGDIWSD